VCCAVGVSNEYIFSLLFTVGYIKLNKTGHNLKKKYMFLGFVVPCIFNHSNKIPN